jgi:hypothetical protein
MDGVLVDFDKGYEKLTGIILGGTHLNDPHFWDPINEAGYDFWINLEWEPDGKELWDYIKKYNPELLSAPSRKNESRVAKHDWVKRELPGVTLILRSAKNKKEFTAPNHILIDDRIDNINDWKNAGGIAIHHKNASDTIKKLKELSL